MLGVSRFCLLRGQVSFVLTKPATRGAEDGGCPRGATVLTLRLYPNHLTTVKRAEGSCQVCSSGLSGLDKVALRIARNIDVIDGHVM
jgi:hypothetical protein